MTVLVPARTARNVGIADLVDLLQAQQRQKLDVVVPATTLHMDDGQLVLAGLDMVMNEDGFTDVNGGYRMTAAADTQLGGLFDIPTRYIKKMRGECPALLDTNVNTWAGLHDPAKKVLLRLLWGASEAHPGSAGICRAILSDKYGVTDNLDVVLSLLDGMREAGLGAQHIKSCDLSDDKLYLRVNAPELMVNAPTLPEGYRVPVPRGPGTAGPPQRILTRCPRASWSPTPRPAAARLPSPPSCGSRFATTGPPSTRTRCGRCTWADAWTRAPSPGPTPPGRPAASS